MGPLNFVSKRPAGFSLAEALVAISIIGLAGTALLLATESASVASQDAVEQLIANGLANQLVDEILGLPYMEKGELPDAWPLGPEAAETTLPVRRALFDDLDDFHGYVAEPVQDAWAIELGHGDGAGGLRHPNFQVSADYFDDWYVVILVSYVDENDLSVSLPIPTTSNARAVEVSVFKVVGGVRREVTRVRRVNSYVPQIG